MAVEDRPIPHEEVGAGGDGVEGVGGDVDDDVSVALLFSFQASICFKLTRGRHR